MESNNLTRYKDSISQYNPWKSTGKEHYKNASKLYKLLSRAEKEEAWRYFNAINHKTLHTPSIENFSKLMSL